MINVKVTKSMELGPKYRFVLNDGSVRVVVICGMRQTESGDLLDVEVDGKVDEYSGLTDAIGQYVASSAL